MPSCLTHLSGKCCEPRVILLLSSASLLRMSPLLDMLFPKVLPSIISISLLLLIITTTGSLVTPVATQSHESHENWGEDACKFIGDRWVGTGKTAISISTAYWPFGLGRFACPGRALAIAGLTQFFLPPAPSPNLTFYRNQADGSDAPVAG